MSVGEIGAGSSRYHKTDAQQGKGLSWKKQLKKYFCIFALPTMLAFTIGFIVPFLYGIFLSFCKFTTVSNWKWVGFKNYSRIFVVNGSVDTSFIHSIWYTALFTLVSVLIINSGIFRNRNGAYKRNQRN